MLDSIPGPVREALSVHLQPVTLRSFSPVTGGCINPGGKLTTSTGDYFIKWNDRTAFPSMFEKEARGLHLLRGAQSIRVTKVIGFGEQENFQYIILEWITSVRKAKNFWSVLGKHLAELHHQSAPAYGLDHDNYIGSLHQNNQPLNSWLEFFINQRIEPQIKLAIEDGKPVQSLMRKMQMFYKKIENLLPPGQPALIHGDLWDGNLLADEAGRPCLIDPAVYFGHREAEIAYTRLFGQFDPSFYDSYQESFPMESGFDQRVDIYNLYPLLVHVNLFGGSYIRQSEDVVNRFI